jgi:hypothetical protein
MNRRLYIACLVTAAVASLSVTDSGAAAVPPVPVRSSTQAPEVTNSLRALAVLKSYGYTWTTDSGALKAIKHWQKVNGLVVDGIVGPQTLNSLGISARIPNVTGSVAPTAEPVTQPQPAVRATPPAGTVADIIRSIWPDELEDHALQIARRESNLQPAARNSCCYGLFQIHWQAHRSWLAGIGITSASQLLDADTNARAAYALYQRAGGWGPWAL